MNSSWWVDLRAHSSDHREASVVPERGEASLHGAGHQPVALLDVWVRAETRAHVDRAERSDRDLRGQRDAAGQVENGHAEWRTEHKRQHLDAQEAVELQRTR